MDDLLLKARAVELIATHQARSFRRRVFMSYVAGIVTGLAFAFSLELLL